MVKSSVMMGLTPRAVERLMLVVSLWEVQLSDDETAYPSANPFSTCSFGGFGLRGGVFGGEEGTMDTETLCHVCCNTYIHPSLIVDGTALRMCLRPCCK
jgi:hypothetical protein